MQGYNPWWVGEEDFTYLEWVTSPVKWTPEVVEKLSLQPFSLNFIYGPRQVGKTTAIKILIHRLLKEVDRRAIFYYSCDELTDFKELGAVLDNYLSARDEWGIKTSYIFLDEITFVEEWWRALKSRIDRGVFRRDVLTLSGSLSLELKKQRELFPGRRGAGGDYTLLPLSFNQYARVVGGLEIVRGGVEGIDRAVKANTLYSDKLRELFKKFLSTGGFPPAIKDLYLYGRVRPESVKIYLDWMKSDWRREGKSDKYMKEVLSYIMRARGTPISWNGISSETGINSPHTVRSYVEVLEGTYVAIVLHHLKPDSRVDYRKNKKIHLTDPLIFRAVSTFIGREAGEEWIVEALLASHLGRYGDVYHWRNSTEVDSIVLIGGEQIGFEVTRGIKRWRKPHHIKRAYLLDRENLHLYLASL
ncbi:MAG: ATP-binding protein [Thermoplasmata archaeon]|nr:ATP-binding protein [Thermoplasmata archaeon]